MSSYSEMRHESDHARFIGHICVWLHTVFIDQKMINILQWHMINTDCFSVVAVGERIMSLISYFCSCCVYRIYSISCVPKALRLLCFCCHPVGHSCIMLSCCPSVHMHNRADAFSDRFAVDF